MKSYMEGNGSKNDGGTGIYKSVIDGDVSFLSQHFTSAFPLFVHMGHQ